MVYIIIMYYISCMKTKTQTSTMMFRSKVDIETSDIFFNFGTPIFDQYTRKDIQGTQEGYQAALLEDATNFLDIVVREGVTPQDLVDDFLNRL